MAKGSGFCIDDGVAEIYNGNLCLGFNIAHLLIFGLLIGQRVGVTAEKESCPHVKKESIRLYFLSIVGRYRVV